MGDNNGDARGELGGTHAGTNSTVSLDDIPDADRRHLLIIVDSVPFTLVKEMRDAGRFRLFHSPSRVVSPFPAMTDLSLAEFFGVSPTPGVESEHFDGRRLRGGLFSYAGESNNAHWLAFVDYHLDGILHGAAYLRPNTWFDHELRRIQEQVESNPAAMTTAYCVGPSAIGANQGRDGHVAALIRLDRFCQSIVHASRGHIRITLMSDHGHYLGPSRRVELPRQLERAGYRVGKTLRGPGDVVIPEFGVVSSVAIYTREPAAVARDVISFDGVELVAWSADGIVFVQGRTGRAAISKQDGRLEYTPQTGDPLQWMDIDAAPSPGARQAANPSIESPALSAAVANQRYPDAVHRLWRAFNGLIEHTPDVLVSLEDGRHAGGDLVAGAVNASGVHGNLNAAGSTGFAMTMQGELRPRIRMENLRQELIELGVPVRSPSGTATPMDRTTGVQPEKP